MPSSEHTPLIHNRSAESAAERGLVGVARGAISPNRYKHQHQYRTTTKVNNVESDDVLQVKKIKQRKNVRSFRRKRQDFATWKGRSKSMIVYISNCNSVHVIIMSPHIINTYLSLSLSLNISYISLSKHIIYYLFLTFIIYCIINHC